MFTRTVVEPAIPEREQMREEAFCPPHDFEAAWANPTSGDSETVPALYCHACGEVRAFRIPADQ